MKEVKLTGKANLIRLEIAKNKDASVFYFPTFTPSLEMVMEIAEIGAKIRVSPSMLENVSPLAKKKYGSLFIVDGGGRGRPVEYSPDEVRSVVEQNVLGRISNSEAMEKLGMPKRTFFYWKRKVALGNKG